MKHPLITLLTLGTILASPTVYAGSFSTNFDTGTTPVGSAVYGNGVVEADGGVGNSGCMKLTKALNGQQGSLILDTLDPGGAVTEFTANFKLLIGGGSAIPADGCAFSFSNTIANGTFGETGAGNGLTIGFDIYDNTDGDPNNGTGEAPRINVFWQGALIANTPLLPVAVMASNTFVDVSVAINSAHKLDLVVGGTPVFTNLSIGYQPITNGRFAWGGRTGGLNANQFLDDVAINTTTSTIPAAPASTVFYDFNAGTTPSGTNNYGTAAPQATGGVGDTGHMQLTAAVNGQAGTWTVNDLNAGGPVESIDVSFKLFLSSGTNPPADGFGFHWAPDLPAAGFPGAEEAVGHGLSIGFDVYDNGGGEAPAIDVFWLGSRVGGVKVPQAFLNTNGNFVNARLRLTSQGLIDVVFNETLVIYQLQVPDWTAFSGASYGFAARTGGLNQRQAIDDVAITTVAYAGPIGFVVQPVGQSLVVGGSASFSLVTNDPARTAYQWQQKPVGGSFTNIAGATNSSYTTPPAVTTDNGVQFRCHVTSSGNGSQADSNAVTLLIKDLTRPAVAQINDTFNDGTTVTNTGTAAATQTLSGNYVVQGSGGVGGSGSLLLTTAEASKFTTLVIDDFNVGGGVLGFTAAVNGSFFGDNPADGWSLSWGGGIDSVQAYSAVEHGLGNDLKVGFIYYAGSGPGVEVTWHGTLLAKVSLPVAVLQTAPGAYKEALIRLTPNATLPGATVDVALGGVVLINSLPINDFQPIVGAKFAIGARTGGAVQVHQIDNFCIATTPQAPPEISIASDDENLQQVITFTGILAISSNLVDWTDLNVTSPYAIPYGFLPDRQFYRAHR